MIRKISKRNAMRIASFNEYYGLPWCLGLFRKEFSDWVSCEYWTKEGCFEFGPSTYGYDREFRYEMMGYGHIRTLCNWGLC